MGSSKPGHKGCSLCHCPVNSSGHCCPVSSLIHVNSFKMATGMYLAGNTYGVVQAKALTAHPGIIVLLTCCMILFAPQLLTCLHNHKVDVHTMQIMHSQLRHWKPKQAPSQPPLSASAVTPDKQHRPPKPKPTPSRLSQVSLLMSDQSSSHKYCNTVHA